jgi:hypothetical protein
MWKLGMAVGLCWLAGCGAVETVPPVEPAAEQQRAHELEASDQTVQPGEPGAPARRCGPQASGETSIPCPPGPTGQGGGSGSGGGQTQQ